MKIYWAIVGLCFVPMLLFLGMALGGVVLETVGMPLRGDSSALGFGLFFTAAGGVVIGIPLALVGIFLNWNKK